MGLSFEHLDQLVFVITTSVEKLKTECNQQDRDVPSLADTFTYPTDSEDVPANLQEIIQSIQGSCAQLSALVAPPQRTVATKAMEFMTSACLATVSHAKVADQLQAFPNGLHVNELSKVTGLEANCLARMLRLLATKHIFREIFPDHFVNNRLSMQLVSSNPLSAFVGLCGDEIMTASTALYDSVACLRSEKNRTAWSRATGNPDPVWAYYEQQDPVRYERFRRAMAGFSSVVTLESTLHGYRWEELPPGTKICDLGGGLGHVSMHIAQTYSHVHVVLQDLPNTIAEAKHVWKEKAPAVVTEGRVEFVPINFLEEAPVADCDYYFMKNVIHNWSDANAAIILLNIRKSMKASSRLLIQEFVIQHVSDSGAEPNDRAQAMAITSAPEPLLSNFGDGNILPYYLDIAMMAFINSQQRTLEEFSELGAKAGFEMIKVWNCGEMKLIEYKLNL